jgi:hypothetical protein
MNTAESPFLHEGLTGYDWADDNTFDEWYRRTFPTPATSCEIEERMNVQLEELNRVHSMSEDEVCLAYNVDSRQDIIDLIKEEIKILDDELDVACRREDYDTCFEENEAEYYAQQRQFLKSLIKGE